MLYVGRQTDRQADMLKEKMKRDKGRGNFKRTAFTASTCV